MIQKDPCTVIKEKIVLSVVIPFYNEIELIDRAVSSVLSQCNSDIDIELLICNDGEFSNKQIQAKIGGLSGSVYVISNIFSKGPGGARNTGIACSRGSLVAFLDADDYWLPGKINAQLAEIKRGSTFVTTAYKLDKGEAVLHPPFSINEPIDVFLFRGIGTSTVMVTQELLSGQRFRDLRFAQDIDFWYALALKPEFSYSAVDTCFVVYNTSGTTKNKFVQLLYFYNVLCINRVALFNRARVLISYAASGLFNHYLKRFFT